MFQDPVSDHPDVAACLQKLHDFGAFARHLCPAGFGLRILFQAAKFKAVHFKINLCQAMFGGAANREGGVADGYDFLLLHERLKPHREKRVIDDAASLAQARLFLSEIASARVVIPAPNKSNEPGSGTLVKLPTISPESLMPLRKVTNLSPLLGAV